MSELLQLGLTEDDVLDRAREASPVDLEQLLLSLERVLEVVSAKETFTEAKGLPGKLSVVKKRYADDLSSLMSDLKDGAISPKEFEKQVRPLVSQNFRQAFELGRGGKTTEGDEEWLKRAVDSEVGYARDLAGQVAKGSEITPDARANRYAAALDGVSWNGKVESMPDDVVIHWQLGQAEHCDSCILLACLLTFHLTIETRRGKILLKDVEIGDEVLTHEGRFRRVLAKPVRPSTAGKRCAVLCTTEGLVGITADHPLWTRRGWMTAEEAFHAGERCLPGLRQRDRQEGGAVQELCGVPKGGTPDLRAAQVGGLQVFNIKEKMFSNLLRGWEVEDCLASSMAMGDEQWKGSFGLPCASQEWESFRRPVGKFGVEGSPEASFRSQQGRKKFSVAWWQAARNCLRSLWSNYGALEIGKILFSRVSSIGQKNESHSSIDMCSLREGIREIPLQDESTRTRSIFLLSELLSGASVGREEHEDPAVRMLQAIYQSKKIPDQELEVGQVLLLPGLLPEGSLLYDLTVEEDHSFVAAGLVVHNSHSPYDKWSLPTTPRAGDTDCRMNCKCKLVFERGEGAGEPKSGAFGIDAYLDPNEIPVPKQGQGLLDWLRPPEPPEGLRRPEGEERLAVDGMFAEVNYFRRLMSQIDEELDPEGFLEVAAARKEANAKLIDYMEQRSLWDRPQLSVDDAITGRDIPLLAERELFEQGISGEALADENVAREVSKLVDRYRLDVGKKFKGGR